MALKSTVFRCALAVADIDRGHYADYPLTLAQHPSETGERLLMRVLAFAHNAHERLEFGRGVSATEDAALWQRDLTGAIELWVDLGQPEPRNLARACGRALQVRLYTWDRRRAEVWWKGAAAELARHRNLEVWHFDGDTVAALAALADRSLDLQCTIQDGTLWLTAAGQGLNITPERWYPAPD